MCAIAYAMHLEELDRRASTAVQAALNAQAQGAKVDIPDPAAMRKEFDDWLMQDDQDVDPVELIKMRALGVSRGR